MRWVSRRLLPVFLASTLIATEAFSASLTFVEQTRLVFDATKNAVAFPIKNDSTLNYLVKCAVRDVDETGRPQGVNPDFAILPEVMVLAPKARQTLQVVRLSGQYPQDRESVFYLNGYFVPQMQGKVENPFNLAVSVNVKMFYRPKALVNLEAVKSIADRLQFTLHRDRLEVTNPSAYYATFNSLALGRQTFEVKALQQMVPPFGEASYRIEPLEKNTSTTVSWSLIDELGNETSLLSRSLKVE